MAGPRIVAIILAVTAALLVGCAPREGPPRCVRVVEGNLGNWAKWVDCPPGVPANSTLRH